MNKHSKFNREREKLTVHLAESVLNTESRKSAIGMRSHDSYDTASLRVETSSDNPQYDVFTREDTSDLLSIVLHNANCGSPLLPHELGGFTNGSLESNSGSSSTSVEDRSEVGERHFVAKSLNVSEKWIGGSLSSSELFLSTFESGVKFLRGSVSLLELFERLVENLGDIEETDNISVFVTDGL